MPILEVVTQQAGLVGVAPKWIYIATNDTIAEVTTTGYLNKLVQQGNYSFSESDMALVTTKTSESATSTQVAVLEVSKSGANWSLVPTNTPGSVTLPTIANNIIVSTNTTGGLANTTATAINRGSIQAGLSGDAGTLISYPATAANGSLIVAAVNAGANFTTTISNSTMGQSSVISIPDPGTATASFVLDNGTTQIISTGNLQLLLGNFIAGDTSGTASGGKFISWPTTTGNGSLQLYATNAGGAFTTSITNAVTTQSQVISIPNAGAATANFILSAASTTQTLSTSLSFVGGGTNIQLTGGGNFLAGASGAAGAVYSYPATAANGSLGLVAVNAGGAFDTIISNGTMGQTTTYTIPDVSAATGQFLVKTAALVNGNLVQASGTAGVTVDAGIATSNVQLKTQVKAAATSDIGGAGAGPISVVVAGLTASSIIVATIASSSNTVAVAKCIGTATGFDVTFTGDPGAACVLNYVAYIVGQ